MRADRQKETSRHTQHNTSQLIIDGQYTIAYP